MARSKLLLISVLIFAATFAGFSQAVEIDDLVEKITREVSGNRARDYTMRLWQYDKWNTFPMWKKTADEAQAIMIERGFDEADVVHTPADGVTKYGDLTNPIGWDCKSATLEIIEPKGLPDQYRYLCDYRDNPTSICFFSCPTPPEGIETELVLVENASEESLSKLDVDGKIILLSSNVGGMKKHLDKYGVRGILSDYIERGARDYVNENNWFNTWSDFPGGWLMTATDSRKNFAFSISQKKGAYIRNLLKQGKKVKVRAIIDSKYDTNETLPYVSGALKGSNRPDEDVLIAGHMYEWGANDNCTGSAAILEAVGVINDLVKRGELRRPKRSIRVWLGFEHYGSIAYTMDNIDRIRKGTIASVCCDTPAENYDLSTTAWNVTMNFNASPSFTDAIFPVIAESYYSRYEPTKQWKTIPFKSGRDNFFGEPLIGAPLNAVSMNNGGHLHHNSMDTIEKVDPRSLRDLSILNAVYLYYMADAGVDEAPMIASIAHDRALMAIREKTTDMKERMRNANNGEALGQILAHGIRSIEYYTGLQKDAVNYIECLAGDHEKDAVRKAIAPYLKDIDNFGRMMVKHYQAEVKAKAKAESIKIVAYKEKTGDWERKAEKIIPKRSIPGPLTLEGIPRSEWKEVRSSPRWWSSRSWAATSYFWCDGKRNLNEIKELMEIEAGSSVRNFDLINFYTFLEKFDIVKFVK